MKKIFLLLYTIVIAVSAVGCANNTYDDTAVYTEDTTLGEGVKTITIKIVDDESKAINLSINTDCDNLGDALKEHNLVSGDNSAYGLYIKMVNGVVADFDKNGAYWAFSKNGQQLMTGADGEKIENGNTYEIVYTK